MNIKPSFILLLLSLVASDLFSQVIQKEFILFDTDASEITAEHAEQLDQLIRQINTLDHPRVFLTGHTDSRGTLSYNQNLSKKRVEAVYQYLLKSGVLKEIIALDYFGEIHPIATNETAEARSRNRRVEVELKSMVVLSDSNKGFEILDSGELEAPVVKGDEAGPIEDIQELLISLKKEKQSFCVQQDRDTILQGAEGTLLFYEANSLNLGKQVCNCVEFQLTEFYSPADLMLHNMHTQAGRRLLETRGMIRIEAFCAGKKLKLKSGKKLNIYFPDVEETKDFQLFRGRETPANHSVDWSPDSRANRMGCFADNGFERYCNYSFFLKRWFCKWKQKRLARSMNRRQISRANRARQMNPDADLSALVYSLGNGNPCNVFGTGRLGWINCDRFLKEFPQRLLADVYLDEKPEKNIITYMVFKDIQSVMLGNNAGRGQFYFGNIPPGKEVWIVAIKKETEQLKLAIQEHNTDDQLIAALDFKDIDQEALKESLEQIGW